MFFYASKIGWFLATPSNALTFLAVAGIILGFTRWRRTGLVLTGLAVFGFLVGGLSPLANAVLLPLENRFPAYAEDGQPVHGIILLGGAVDPINTARRGQIIANEAGERLMQTLVLARRHPQARIVISGGTGSILDPAEAEAPPTASYFEAAGLAADRITVEARSRTTDENAAYTRALVRPVAGERWLLVTSAWHMPRSMGAFRRAGFSLTAHPVDFRTEESGVLDPTFASVSDGLRRLDLGTREWVGLAVYWLSGRSSELFPGPSSDSESR